MNVTLAKLHVNEAHGFERRIEPVRIGVPLSKGAASDHRDIVLYDAAGKLLPMQSRALARWIDGSIKWLLVDTLVDVSPHGKTSLSLQREVTSERNASSRLTCRLSAEHIEIDTGVAQFHLPTAGVGLIGVRNNSGQAVIERKDAQLCMTGADGSPWRIDLDPPHVEEEGEVRVTVRREGIATSNRGDRSLRVKLRFSFTLDSSAVAIDVEVWNPSAALHPGGLWDLGDPRSNTFRDFSIDLRIEGALPAVRWRTEIGGVEKTSSAPLLIHQNSSGGECWNSPNHVDRDGKLTVSFRGYRVCAANGELIDSGRRATPYIAVDAAVGSVAVTVQQFWENFPKTLRCSGGTLSIGLFPRESAQLFELQPGEKKRHTVLIDFSREGGPDRVRQFQQPLEVTLDPDAVASSRTVSYVLPQAHDPNTLYLNYLNSIIEGSHSFFAKREIIDEFGWRNFGDLYADHEAVNHQGPEPFISHYNNQYDFIYGAGFHFLRSADVRWFSLMRDAARHAIDIDIYHTIDDKPGFSGGLFWHTDHYKPALTCTHRTYSKGNAGGASYGGGPSNEHNYTSGLLLYHWLTGDPEARAAVCEMAEWVISMDDGSRTLFSFLDEGPTGLASKSRDADFHKPGRGAGNSINALLDAHAVTGQRRFMQKAEELIQRVIHPADEVDTLELDQPETRWSYVVFLQILGKYLDRKLELGERDYAFWHSRAALLHYAHWMVRNEVPYKDVLHKVELPTETWPAHDVRKCHVLHLAARYAEAPERSAFTDRATYFFERCLADLLSFKTAYLTRPQVILCVYGGIHAHFQASPHDLELTSPPAYDFGAPAVFATQRARLAKSVRRKLSSIGREAGRIASERLHYVRRRMRR